MKVLIADDNQMSLMVLQYALTASGLKVETAANGREALDRLRAGGHRLVITDWEMPEMDGLELCRAIRAEAALGPMHVILLTGHNSPEEREKGLGAGADEVISKPFNPTDLLARVRAAESALSQKTSGGA